VVWYSNTGDCAGVFYCCGGAMSGGGAGGREVAEFTHVKCLYEFVYIYLYVKNYMNSVFGIVYNTQVRHGGLDNNKV
jgi:hypothetical protein